MTNSEILEAVLPYMSYDLECEILNYKSDYVGIQHSIVNGFYQCNDVPHFTYNGGAIGKDPSIIRFKLRPLSELNKPCLEGGLTPIAELAKMVYSDIYGYAEFKELEILEESGNYGVIGLDDDSDRIGFSFEQELNSSEFYFSMNHTKLRVNQQKLFRQLCKWHFDLFGLIEKGYAIIKEDNNG